MRPVVPYDGWIRRTVCVWLVASLGGAVAAEGEVGERTSAGRLGSSSARSGLVGTYTDGERTVVVIAATPDFYLEPEESLHPVLEPSFDAEWAGFLSILEGGRYEFRSGDAEIYLRGRRLTSREVHLDSGFHPVRITYRRTPGVARLRLRWKSEHFSEESVPSSVLFHAEESEPLRRQRAVERGRFLIEEYGCTNCHATESPSLVARRGPDLTGIGSRARAPWVDRWLEDPSHFRPGAAMPALLDDAGRREVAAYLATLGVKERATTPATIVTPHHIGKGQELYESIGCHACHDLPELSLDGMGSKTSPVALAAYLRDPRRVDPLGPMPSLLLTDEEAWTLAAFLVQSRCKEFEAPIANAAPGDSEKGKKLVQRSGCLACHRLHPPGDSEPLRNTFSAPPLEALRAGGGCLATAPEAGLPRYRLTNEERVALAAFIASREKAPDISLAPVHATARRLRQLWCTACHRRDGQGPQQPLLDRVPALTGVGAKLKTNWIDEVLTNRRRVRPELNLRMPHYSIPLVKPLVTGLVASDGLGPADEVARHPSVASHELTAFESAGVDLIGNDATKGGLSCIACHDYGEFRPIADEKGPQMIGVTERVRFDWFRRWMYNPGRIVSGTSMPVFFSEYSKKDADECIARLWAALALGKDMPRPYGVGVEMLASGSETFPTPIHTAVVIRFPLPGATAAAIAVGMPRQGKTPAISYCFDAAECRLVYAWQGGFLDLSGSLGKKMEYPQLLGEVFYRTTRFPLRTSAVDHIPSRRFRGYRIVEGFPEFRYEVDGLDTRERVVPLRSGNGFVHEFRLERVDRRMWFVVNESQAVDWTSTVGRFEGGRLAIPRGEDVRFDVRVVRHEPAGTTGEVGEP